MCTIKCSFLQIELDAASKPSAMTQSKQSAAMTADRRLTTESRGMAN